MGRLLSILIVLFLMTLISACGKSKDQFRPLVGEITTQYDHMLAQFNSDLSELGYETIDFSQTEIRIGDLSPLNPGLVAGICFGRNTTREGRSIIGLSSYKTFQFNTLTLYHEIGHCFLGLGHHEGYTLMNLATSPVIAFDFQDSKEKRLALVQILLNESGFLKRR